MKAHIAASDHLQADRIAEGCARELRGRALELRVLAEVDSTSSEVIRWRQELDPSEPALLAVVADRQHAGRGRRGRRWNTGSGRAIHLSLARRLQTKHGLGALGLACAVAVHRVLADLGGQGLAVKWPNDIVCKVDGEYAYGKLGGLLLEASPAPSSSSGHDVVVGLGLNVALAPDLRATLEAQTDYAVADFTTVGLGARDRSDTVGALLASLVRSLECFEAQGFAPFRPAWAEVDMLRGRLVEVLGPDGARREGLASGIDEQGALRVRVPGEPAPLAIHAGEVSVRPR